MSHLPRPDTKFKFLSFGIIGVLSLAGLGQYIFSPTYGAQLGNRRLQLSSAQIGASADYLVSFNLSSNGPFGSVVIQFCANDPFPGTSCTVPGGLTAASATLTSQTGPGGFTINTSASTANKLVLSRNPANALIGPVSFRFTNVTNPSAPGSYYARLQTFAGNDASGPASNDGGLAFAINNSLAISAEVPPYLIFCTGITIGNLNCANATGDYIDFGELSPNRTSSGSSQMLVATNAQDGYNVHIDGTTLTSGNNEITALTSSDVSRPGTPQFGFNLRANSTPASGVDPSGPGTGTPLGIYGQPNSYRFVPGDTIITHAAPDNLRKFTASYIANVPRTQAPGIYVSTLTYICLATF